MQLTNVAHQQREVVANAASLRSRDSSFVYVDGYVPQSVENGILDCES